ncbi:MAG: FG-GAP repeat domain-containing protein, partial [Acidobacteriota bacterium]
MQLFVRDEPSVRHHAWCVLLLLLLPACARVIQSPGDAAPRADAALDLPLGDGSRDRPTSWDRSGEVAAVAGDGPLDRARTGEPAIHAELGSGPVVVLVSPPSGSTSAAVDVPLVFSVTSGAPLAGCEVTLDGQTTSVGTVSGMGVLTAIGISDGEHAWKVSCVDTLNRSGGAGPALFASTPLSLTGCKTAGWLSGTKYRLTTDLVEVKGDCFVIDAAKVRLDGGGRIVSSAKRKDLVLSRWTDEPLQVVANQIGQPVPFVPIWKSPYTAKHWQNPTVADLDGDGDLDVVSPEYEGSLRVFLNDGKGDLGSASVWAAGGGMGYDVTRAFDVNHDGSLDLVCSHDGEAEVVFQNDGTGKAFTAPWKGNLGTYTHALDLGDFNRDGWLDLITGSNVATNADDHHHLALNTTLPGAAATFSEVWVSDGKSDRGGVPTLVADLNGDGYDDLVLGRDVADNDKASYVRLNNGKGTAWSQTFTSATALPFRAADLDGDGDTDLLLASLDGTGKQTSIASYLNDGKGSFAGATKVGLAGTIGVAALAHLDGDALPDLVLGPGDGKGVLTVYRNAGGGQFKLLWAGNVGEETTSIEPADLDHDGDLDLVVTRALYGAAVPSHAVLLNDGSGGMKEVWSKYASTAGNGFVAL